jgi:membrane-bound lytic murein transglycosylase A
MRTIGLALLLLAAQPRAEEPSPASLPGWEQDHQATVLPALLGGCRMLALAPERFLTPPSLAAACGEALTLAPGDDAGMRAWLERSFRPRPPVPLLLTGYYEPELRGALAPDERHAVPLRSRPADLVDTDPATAPREMRGRRAGRLVDGRLQPYPDRAAIEAGAIDAAAAPLLWVADGVEKFFLQIQGSGRVLLPDKRVIRVNYAGQNGHPYIAIGRVLADRGVMPREQVTMQAIRGWLAAASSGGAAALLNANPSYVFFRRADELRPKDGPLGTLGVPLLPGRSIAVDRAHLPLGLPVWLVTRDPVSGRPFARLTIALDTGGAIRGAGRADLFWGWGAEAAERAGRTRETGELYLLLPRPPELAAATE